MNPESKTCKNCTKLFTIEPEDFVFYAKINVPPPTLCPLCRAQRRMSWLTIRAFYKRPDVNGKIIFSHWPAESPVKVMDHDDWWKDDVENLQYGRAYDPLRSFFEQFKELLHAVPLSSRSIIRLVRSDYCDHAADLKDCYLVFSADGAENTFYSSSLINLKDSADISHGGSLELCYDSLLIENCYRTFGSRFCTECADVYFSRDCVGCSNCFGCANLRKKSYHIFNQPYQKEAYFAELGKMNLGSWTTRQEAEKKARAFWLTQPVRYAHSHHNQNSTGEGVARSKNVRDSYLVLDGENCRYTQFVYEGVKECYDYTIWGNKSELTYECAECGEQNQRLKFCFDCWPASRDLEYCVQCHSSANLFGCVGLRKKEYCILNKQYSQSEYEALKSKVKSQMSEDGEYGEFFPASMSPSGYNETIAHEFFPLTESEAREKGFNWRDVVERNYQISMRDESIPDHIKDVPDSITQEIIECAHSGKCNEECATAFRITPAELTFYRRLQIPMPHLCPSCRHFVRIKDRLPMELFLRMCAKCNTPIETPYAPDRPEIVYCESCYQQEIV